MVATPSAVRRQQINGWFIVDIKEFFPWVRMIAVEIYRPLPASILLEDLVQDGMVGLIKAFREYREDSGVNFRTFANNKIRWAILDGLRTGDWAERSVRGNANKVATTVSVLQRELGRPPGYGEIAETLGIRIADVASILGEAYGYQFVRLDDTTTPDALEIPDYSNDPATLVERRQAYSNAVACLKTLEASERRTFVLRVICEKSGRETAGELGVSESRISQLLKSASDKIARCGQLN